MGVEAWETKNLMLVFRKTAVDIMDWNRAL